MSGHGVGREAAEGLRWVYRHPTLRAHAVGSHGWFLCCAIAGAVLPPFALRTLGLSPFGLGVALVVGGIGGLLGSLVATRLGTRFGVGRVVLMCNAATAVAWALIALGTDRWTGWAVFGAGQLLFGVSLGAENANSMGYRQTVTPDNLQGRMNATIRSINRAMVVIGAPLGGVIGDQVGFRTMLWIAATGFFLVAVGLALTPYRDARLDDAWAAPGPQSDQSAAT
jgi:MFS family permease